MVKEGEMSEKNKTERQKPWKNKDGSSKTKEERKRDRKERREKGIKDAKDYQTAAHERVAKAAGYEPYLNKKDRKLLSDKLDKGALGSHAQLIKALLRRKGVMLTQGDTPDGVTQMQVEKEPETVMPPMAVAPPQVSTPDELASRFLATLADPGCLVTPFIDDLHVCGQPTGVIRSNPISWTAPNSNYTAFFVCPSLAGCVATSISTLMMGFGYNTYASTGSPAITITELIGSGNWVNNWGNTTSSLRLFPYSMALNITPQIPEAVVQGVFWTGNAPVGSVLGATLADLIRMSNEMKAETGGYTYRIKSSIVEKGLVHQPYGSFSASALPMDERVSWVILGPNSYGSIAGSNPAALPFTINAVANYLWVPAPQPQVSPTMEAQAKANTSIELPADTKANVDNKGGILATIALPMQALGFLLGLAPNPIARGVGAGLSIAGQIAERYADVPSYSSQIMDLEYFEGLIHRRWVDWDQYRYDVAELVEKYLACSDALKKAMGKATLESEEFKQSLPPPKTKLSRGCLHFYYGENQSEEEAITQRYEELWKRVPRAKSVDTTFSSVRR